MKYSDIPLPPEGEQPSITNGVSLEDLLSLQKKMAVKASDAATKHAMPVCESHQPTERESSVEELNMDLPLVVVIHEEQLCGSCVKTKLKCMTSDVRFQWLKMDVQIAEQVSHSQPYAVMVQFAPNYLDVAVAIVKTLQLKQPHLPIFALGSAQDSQAMLFALRAGVQDFFDIEASEDLMRQSFKDLLMKGKAQEPKSPNASAPLTAILSSRAGGGSSLLAAHIAVYLQHALHGSISSAEGQKEDNELSTLLLDLGAPAGDGALYLDVVSEFDFIEAVQNLRRFDLKMASAGLTQHTSGLRLLSLPRQSNQMREVAYAEADLLVQRLGEFFQHIVADLGGVSQTTLAMRVALKATKIWIVCEQSLPSVVSTTELVRQLETQQVQRSAMGLIVSRYDRNLELSAQHIADQLQLPLVMVVPERRVELLQAVNQGMLMSPQARRDPYVQAVHKLVRLLLQDQQVAARPKQSAISKLLQRMRGG